MLPAKSSVFSDPPSTSSCSRSKSALLSGENRASTFVSFSMRFKRSLPDFGSATNLPASNLVHGAKSLLKADAGEVRSGKIRIECEASSVANFAAVAISKQRIELFFKRPSLAAQRIVPGVAQRAQVVQQIVEAKIILVAFAGFQMRQDRRGLLAGGGVETFQITHHAGNRKRSNNALAGIRKLVGADEGARLENGGPEIVVRFVGDDFRF